MTTTATDFDLPPPAYEVTQDELDRKISRALEDSLHITESRPTQPTTMDEEGWEVWDEAAFEAAFEAAARSNGSNSAQGAAASSSTALSSSRALPPVAPEKAPFPIEPLSVTRNPGKERPSWFAEAQLHVPSSSTSNGESSSSGPSSAGLSGAGSPSAQPWSAHQPTSSPTESPRVHTLPLDNRDDSSLQPPPFTPIGPSLDGPPYQEVVLTCPPQGSRTPSPLTSPTLTLASLPSQLQSQYQYDVSLLSGSSRPQSMHPTSPPMPSSRPSSSYGGPPPAARPSGLAEQQQRHQTMPPPRRNQRMGPRPVSSVSAVSKMADTVISFNPASAYHKPQPQHSATNLTTSAPVHHASAFYNSAVAMHTGGSSHPVQGHGNGIVHRPQPHHAATTGGIYTPAAAYAAQHRPTESFSKPQPYQSSSAHFSTAYGHAAPAQPAGGQSHYSQSLYNPLFQGQSATHLINGHGTNGNIHTPAANGYTLGSYPAVQSYQPTSYMSSNPAPPTAPQHVQYAAYPSAQGGIPSPPNMSPPATQYAHQQLPHAQATTYAHSPPVVSPQLSQYSTQTSQYTGSSGSPPMLTPQTSQYSQQGLPSAGYTQPMQQYSLNPSVSPPPSAGFAQPPQQYHAAQAARPGYAAGGHLPSATAQLEAQTANTELRTARVEMWAQGMGLAAAGISIAGTLMGMTDDSGGGGGADAGTTTQ